MPQTVRRIDAIHQLFNALQAELAEAPDGYLKETLLPDLNRLRDDFNLAIELTTEEMEAWGKAEIPDGSLSEWIHD